MSPAEKSAPLDSAAAAKAAFAAIENRPFPDDVFTAPELRWAVIGCGVIANQMATSLALAGRTLAGVANRTREKAVAFAEKYHVARVYDTVEELYADPAIDAIYVTTPHNTHIRYLRDALAAGKHVLCEKSITLNSEELDEARAIAREHGVVLMDATTILHMPLYRELLRRAEAGEFGRMNLAQLNFGSYKEYGDLTNRFYNINLAGGAMLDIGVYALSLDAPVHGEPADRGGLARQPLRDGRGRGGRHRLPQRRGPARRGLAHAPLQAAQARRPQLRQVLRRGHGVSARRHRHHRVDRRRTARDRDRGR